MKMKWRLNLSALTGLALLGAAPTASYATEAPQLKIDDSIVAVKTYSFDGSYKQIRLISTLMEVYPAITIEIFERGGEGENSVVYYSQEFETRFIGSGIPVKAQGPIANMSWNRAKKKVSIQLGNKICTLGIKSETAIAADGTSSPVISSPSSFICRVQR